MIRQLAAVACILSLSSCAWVGRGGLESMNQPSGIGTVAINLEVASVMTTKKTLADHVATWVTGRDCSTVRVERDGDSWCRDWPNPPAPPPQLYCYASLARPTCYSQPYTEGNDRLIGFVPASPPIRR